jgi:hypothetical protein
MRHKTKEIMQRQWQEKNRGKRSYILGQLNVIYSTTVFPLRLVVFPYILRSQ